MSHTITITKLPDEASDDIEYEFGGTHSSNCEYYLPCRKDWHRHPKTFDDTYDEGWSTKRAGYHAYLDGQWMVPVDPEKSCALSLVFEGYNPDESLAGLAVGETRDVKCEWDGGDWELIVLPKPTEAVAS